MTSPWRIVTGTGATASAAFCARLGGQLEVERGVGDHERADDLGGEHPLGLVELARHPPGEAGPGVLDLGVAQLGPQGRVEDAGGFGPDGRPARRIEPDERRLRGVGQVGQVGGEQRLAGLGG